MTLVEFLGYLKAGGAALVPVLSVWLWLEREERKSAQSELTKISKEIAPALERIANTQKLTSEAIEKTRDTLEKVWQALVIQKRPNGKGR